MDKNYIVYKLTNEETGMSYIGITNNWNRRISAHRSRKLGTRISIAIQDFGWDSFTSEFLYTGISKPVALNLEQQTMREQKTIYPDGYNMVGKYPKQPKQPKIKQTDIISLEEFRALKQALKNQS